MTSAEAIAFVRKRGVVLEAATGTVPSLVETIVGGPVRGNWWDHPRGKEIFRLTRVVRSSEQILVCRLISGKITFVHRRLWPALVRCANRFRVDRISRVQEEHTSSGRHEASTIQFPNWVPAEVSVQAQKLTEEAALAKLAPYIPGLP